MARFVRLLRGAFTTADGWILADEMFDSDYQADKIAQDQAFSRIKDSLRKALGAEADCLVCRDGRGKMRVDVRPEAISWDEALLTLPFTPLRDAVVQLAAARDNWRRRPPKEDP